MEVGAPSPGEEEEGLTPQLHIENGGEDMLSPPSIRHKDVWIRSVKERSDKYRKHFSLLLSR